MLKNFLFIVSILFSNLACSNEESFKKIVDSYTKIAYATYEDSLISAKSLRNAIDYFLSNPTSENLSLAKSAWLASRIPYQQSEVFRFYGGMKALFFCMGCLVVTICKPSCISS